MISWTVLRFLASSFATFSKVPFILSKAHSETFHFISDSVLACSSHSPLLKARKPCFIILCVCHCSISLAASTLWLAIPAATDPVHLRAFLLQLVLETFSLLLFLGKHILTFLVRVVLFPSFSTALHDAPFSL